MSHSRSNNRWSRKFKDQTTKLVLPLFSDVLRQRAGVLNYLVVASTVVVTKLPFVMAFFHSHYYSTGIERFHQPTKTGVCNSLSMSLNTPRLERSKRSPHTP